MSLKIGFESAHDGHDLYMQCKQFMRLTNKIENCHDRLDYEKDKEIREHLKNSVDYYRDGQSILRGKMRQTLERAIDMTVLKKRIAEAKAQDKK